MLQEVACVYAVCDGCGESCENGNGFVCHYPAELPGEAEDDAQNADWLMWNNQHWCKGCWPSCDFCSHTFGEHDYGEAECEEDGCDCPTFRVYPKKDS